MLRMRAQSDNGSWAAAGGLIVPSGGSPVGLAVAFASSKSRLGGGGTVVPPPYRASSPGSGPPPTHGPGDAVTAGKIGSSLSSSGTGGSGTGAGSGSGRLLRSLSRGLSAVAAGLSLAAGGSSLAAGSSGASGDCRSTPHIWPQGKQARMGDVCRWITSLRSSSPTHT